MIATPPELFQAHIYLHQYVQRAPGTSSVGEIRLPLGHELLFLGIWLKPSIACNAVEILWRRRRVTDRGSKTEIICCQMDLTCNVFIWVSYLWSLNEMFNNLQRNHLFPENGRAEFKVLLSQAFCLGDGKVGLTYRFLPAVSLWFPVAFFLCYKWIVALCQQVKYSSAGKENVCRRHTQHSSTSALGGRPGISHFLKTPSLSINAPFISPSTSQKRWPMNGSIALLHNSSEHPSQRKPHSPCLIELPLFILEADPFLNSLMARPFFSELPKAWSSFTHQTLLRASFVPGPGDARVSWMDITPALPWRTWEEICTEGGNYLLNTHNIPSTELRALGNLEAEGNFCLSVWWSRVLLLL